MKFRHLAKMAGEMGVRSCDFHFCQKRREALGKIRPVFTSVGVDEKTLNQALQSSIEDFEDAIQFFSALQVGASYLITRNPHDFPSDRPVSVLTGEMFVALALFTQ